jgi:putative phosphoribosyl transferase
MTARAFVDRSDAGSRLGALLAQSWSGRQDVIVLGVPRGGVPVAFEVAKALEAPLDVFTVRKLGVPGHEELAFGAVGPGGVRVFNPDVMAHVPPGVVEAVTAEQRRVLEERERSYRGDLPPPDVAGRTAILVDDGLATGASMRAAITALRQMGPASIVVAVPVGTAEACQAVRAEADDVVCALTPEPFIAVGAWYDDFAPTTDAAVRRLLDQGSGRGPGAN